MAAGQVRSDFLAPLLLGATQSDVRRCVGAARLRLGGAQGGGVAHGRPGRCRTPSARRLRLDGPPARESEVLARREAELAEGHASFRYSGYLTVSAPSDDALESAIDTLQHSAGQSRLALRRLYGDQAAAYTCTLPFCRGLQ